MPVLLIALLLIYYNLRFCRANATPWYYSYACVDMLDLISVVLTAAMA